MKWQLTGAWKADGVEASMTVEAPNQRAAESIAAQRGMMVEQAIPAESGAPPMYATPAPQVVHVHHASQPNPGIAALLSFFIPGVGQMYLGDVGAGIAWMIGTIAGYFFCLVPGIVLHIVCIIMAATAKPK